MLEMRIEGTKKCKFGIKINKSNLSNVVRASFLTLRLPD